MNTKRVKELQVGDVFMFYGVERKVITITEKEIVHFPTRGTVKHDQWHKNRQAFGRNCMQRVEVVPHSVIDQRR